ncbi:hypothetical protein [Arthrobacter methylotrophus]
MAEALTQRVYQAKEVLDADSGALESLVVITPGRGLCPYPARGIWE